MKSDTDLADEFIESLIIGDIESYYIENAQKADMGQFVDALAELREKIMDFRDEKDSSVRAEKAKELVKQTIAFRLDGILKNNPNTIKNVAEHRDYYRNRATAAEERVKDLETKLTNAYIAFDRMQERFESMGQKPPKGQGETEG